MSGAEARGKAAELDALFETDEVREVLRDRFYSPARIRPVQARLEPEPEPMEAPRAPAPVAEVERPKAAPRKRRPRAAKRPAHYQVICISLYKEDLARLDEKVAALKENGHRKMSRSALIRYALDHVDLDALPKSY
ncbi:MAG: hypothetical protein AAGH15_23845 [Myxococcota bacterium]